MRFLKFIILLLLLITSIDSNATELRSSGRKVDASNSSVANLGIGAAFPGVWVDSTPYSSIVISVYTDQGSAADGLAIEMGTDGVNAVHIHKFTVEANTPNGAHFEATLTGKYYRIVYTNGGVGTGSFNLSTTPSRAPAGLHMHPVGFTFDDNHPVQLGRTVITGKDETGVYDNVSITRTALDFHDAHVHHEILNLHAILDIANTDTFDQNASVGDSLIEVNNSSQFTANDYIRITESTTFESDILKVIASDGTDPGTLTLDRPLENAYTADVGIITEVSQDLSTANGTIVAPVIYRIAPKSTEIFHIESISLHVTDGTQPGIELFGGIAALTNGLVIRQENTTKRNDAVIRSNGDMKEYFGSEHVEFIQKVGGGDYSTFALWHYLEHSGSIIHLNGATGDTLDFIIQDDLTALTEMEIIVQGHEEL